MMVRGEPSSVNKLTKWVAQVKSFIKWKLIDKGDRPAKKLKEVATTIVGEMPAATKVPPLRHGVNKGLMTTKGPVLE